MFKVRIKRIELADRFENAPQVLQGQVGEGPKATGEYIVASLQGFSENFNAYLDLPLQLLDDTGKLGDEYEITFRKIK